MVQVSKRNWIKVIALLAVLSGGLAALWYTGTGQVAWESQVLPGELSTAHSSLQNDCAACHTSVQGVDEAKCIACHADYPALLGRQPTAFHANIGNCAACHVEHLGPNANLKIMDHEALARIGINTIPGGVDNSNQTNSSLLSTGHPLVSPLEARLDCASCHSTKDKHFGLFGQNCASCHATAAWTIPAF